MNWYYKRHNEDKEADPCPPEVFEAKKFVNGNIKFQFIFRRLLEKLISQ